MFCCAVMQAVYAGTWKLSAIVLAFLCSSLIALLAWPTFVPGTLAYFGEFAGRGLPAVSISPGHHLETNQLHEAFLPGSVLYVTIGDVMRDLYK